MKSKRLQRFGHSRAVDTPCCDFHLHPLLGADLCPIARTHHDSGRRRRFRALAVCPHVAAPAWAEHLVSFFDLRGYRLFPDRAEQPVQYHPYAGFRADSYLFSAGHRLSGDAPVICRKRCRHNLFILHLFPVQELPAGTGVRISVLLVPVYRCRSILFPQLTFFSVLWLFEAHRFQSLTFRSFCGALVGWTMPYWMLFGHAFFYDQIELFYHPFKELATFGDIFNLQILQPWELATLGYLFVLFIVSAAHCVVAGFEDKIRTRAYLQFLIDVTLFLFVLIVLQPSQCSNLLPLLMISNSILIGHLFVLTNNKTSNIFFIVATVCLILLFVFNVWTLL